jgi:hypothetical protein
VFHVSLLERYTANTLLGRTIPPPPPIEIDGEMEYEVEAIVDSRKFRNKLQYRVQWVGYQETSWEPAENLECPEIVTQFHAQYPDKPGPVRVAPGDRSLEGGLSRTEPRPLPRTL